MQRTKSFAESLKRKNFKQADSYQKKNRPVSAVNENNEELNIPEVLSCSFNQSPWLEQIMKNPHH